MPSASQLPEPGPALALSDLFVPSSALAAAAARVEIEFVLPDESARQADAFVASTGLLPDTLHCAAWLLLQHHWRGAVELLLWEAVQGAGGNAAVVGRPCSVNLLQGTTEWLHALDARRRTRDHIVTGMADTDTLWLGLLTADAVPALATT